MTEGVVKMSNHHVKQAFEAAMNNDWDVLEMLLKQNLIDVNVESPMYDGSLLHHAVYAPINPSMIENLIQLGAAIHAIHPETGGTAFHQLLHSTIDRSTLIHLIDVFINAGLDINMLAEDYEGNVYTSLDIAITLDHAELATILRARGAQSGPDW